MDQLKSERELTCPCCGATLVVDLNLGRIIEHHEPVNPDRPELDEAGLVRPVGYVRGSVAETELLEWCRARLAGFKRPRRIAIVDELPKTLTGKIQRYRLRQAAPGSDQ